MDHRTVTELITAFRYLVIDNAFWYAFFDAPISYMLSATTSTLLIIVTAMTVMQHRKLNEATNG